MTFILSKFDTSSNFSARLSGQSFDKKNNLYTLAMLKELDKRDYALLSNLIKVFWPDQLENEEFTPILVSSTGGTFDAMYGPILCKDENNKLVLSAGLIQVPLGNKGGKIPYDGAEIEVDIVSDEFNGYEKSTLLSITMFKPGEKEEEEGITVSYSLPIKFRKLDKDSDEKYPEVKELSTYLKRSPSKLVEWLGLPPQPSLEAIPAKCLHPGTYKAVSYKVIAKRNGGLMALLTVEGATDENGLFTQTYIDPSDDSRENEYPLESVNVFLKDNLIPTLQLEPDISPDKPATYVVKSVTELKNKDGSTKGYRVSDSLLMNDDVVFATDNQEDDLDLDLLSI